MKKIVACLFVLIIAACTFSGNSTSMAGPTATRSITSTVQPSATLALSTTTTIPTAAPMLSPTPTQETVRSPWWNDTVFYELQVRSFYDSNGDGIGDFNGLIEKLDYLNDGNPDTTTDLGITGIWLMPINPSPSTHGYDVTDYYAVNPLFGTLDDFRHLVDEAHRRGIRIITDLVINHSSSQHPWFIQSQDPQSPYRDWYVWEDVDPGWKGPWAQQVWYPFNNDYYYAFFWEGMPDLNYTNPDVTSEMENVTRFWLSDVGIDGFRLDAIGSLIEEGSVTIETQSSHDWFANYYEFYKGIKPEAMTIGEVWREDAVVVPWVTGKQVDLAFEFDLAFAMIASINDGNSSRMLDVLRSGTSQFPSGQYGTFLANHDMHRVMTQIGNDPAKAKAAASLYFVLPGVPFLYYGEEIGMRDEPPDILVPGPMQWSGGTNAGFSTGVPWSPAVVDPTYNVSAETADPESLLAHYRTLISLRNGHPTLRTGEFYILSVANNGLFACLRTTSNESVLAVINLTGSPIQEYQLSLEASSLPQGNYSAISLLDGTELAPLEVADHGVFRGYVPLPEIPPYATVMLLLQSE
ncbi:MAG: alpha-amylase [Anaerolineales bacterium]|nr:MAG: alpha-amylase [Anaerolineales bacterium]